MFLQTDTDFTVWLNYIHLFSLFLLHIWTRICHFGLNSQFQSNSFQQWLLLMIILYSEQINAFLLGNFI